MASLESRLYRKIPWRGSITFWFSAGRILVPGGVLGGGGVKGTLPPGGRGPVPSGPLGRLLHPRLGPMDCQICHRFFGPVCHLRLPAIQNRAEGDLRRGRGPASPCEPAGFALCRDRPFLDRLARRVWKRFDGARFKPCRHRLDLCGSSSHRLGVACVPSAETLVGDGAHNGPVVDLRGRCRRLDL